MILTLHISLKNLEIDSTIVERKLQYLVKLCKATILSSLPIVISQIPICLKLTIETLEKGVKCIQS